ncbi:hypothetical protein ACPF8X_23420 [Streptomyces sp. G35A]
MINQQQETPRAPAPHADHEVLVAVFVGVGDVDGTAEVVRTGHRSQRHFGIAPAGTGVSHHRIPLLRAPAGGLIAVRPLSAGPGLRVAAGRQAGVERATT